MKNYYSIRIKANEDKFEKISDILNVYPNSYNMGWIYEIYVGEDDDYFDFINAFLNILEENFDSLRRIDVKKEDISIWIICEYENECNMEFNPQDLKRLGEHGISLCLSCYK